TIGFFIVPYLNATYPAVGHDYAYFMPRLVDTHLHYKVNGLSIQWYTPSFGGGLPAYPNPHQMQFSLVQLLTWFVNPWWAILASIVIYAAIGLVAAYYFLKQLLGLQPLASILGAVFFSVNGFYFQQMAVGHLSFETFPLFAVIVAIIANPRLPGWLAGIFLSLIYALLIYSGSFYVAFISLLGLLVVIPLIYLLKPSLLPAKRLLVVALWGGILTVLLSGSKVYAVSAFMQLFSRAVHDQYSTNWLTGVGGIIFQLIGTMTIAPLLVLIGKSAVVFVVRLAEWTGSPYSFWELDAGLSPALVVLLAGGALAFLFRKPNRVGAAHRVGAARRKVSIPIKRLLALVCLVSAILLVIEFILAEGIVYPQIRDLPFLRSMRVNHRFTSAFIFPLAVMGAVIFNGWTQNWKSRQKTLVVFLLLNGIALAGMWAYYLIPMKYQVRNFGVGYPLTAYEKIQREGETFVMDRIIPDINDWEVFQSSASGLRPFEPLFGDIETFRTNLHEGSVYDISDGYFNMTDPTGFVFPKENQSIPFERIPVADRDKLTDFIHHRQPKWNLPVAQQLLNWAALITLVVELGSAGIYLAKTWKPFKR
ncbi:MAG: hypothetical protein KJ606_01005, partial [Chloroflexi bacterium]|nr:hypothetical protein [Chloroflexota bacterium]